MRHRQLPPLKKLQRRNEPYRNFFLLFLNNYRATGFLKISNEVYEYLTKIFSEISKHLIVEENNNKDIHINYDISRLTLLK